MTLLSSYLCGEVECPKDESKHTASHHSKDRERQQTIPFAVVLHICPGFNWHYTYPHILEKLHSDSVCVPARSPPPTPLQISEILIEMDQ